MEELVKRVRALTGATAAQIEDYDIEQLIELHDRQVYCAAADVADRLGTDLIGDLDVTSVEDISIDTRRVVDGWRSLADRLRKRCLLEASEAYDDGPAVVEFRPHGYGRGAEAVEHG